MNPTKRENARCLRAKSLSRLLTHQGCTLVLYLVMSSLPTRLILYGLHYSCFLYPNVSSTRMMLLTTTTKMDERQTDRQAGRGRKDAKKTKRNHDGAFADLTKQFKRLSCPFNALKRLAEGRIAITETLAFSLFLFSNKETEIAQTGFEKFLSTFVPTHISLSLFFYDLTKDQRGECEIFLFYTYVEDFKACIIYKAWFCTQKADKIKL